MAGIDFPSGSRPFLLAQKIVSLLPIFIRFVVRSNL